MSNKVTLSSWYELFLIHNFLIDLTVLHMTVLSTNGWTLPSSMRFKGERYHWMSRLSILEFLSLQRDPLRGASSLITGIHTRDEDSFQRPCPAYQKALCRSRFPLSIQCSTWPNLEDSIVKYIRPLYRTANGCNALMAIVDLVAILCDSRNCKAMLPCKGEPCAVHEGKALLLLLLL